MARIATARGFGAGRLIEPGEPVPDGVPAGSWIRETGGGTAAPSAPVPPAFARFDHDGDGRPGGSRPGRESTAATGAARRRGRKAAR